MSKLLYLQASPRVKRSKSRAVADAFADAWARAAPDREVQTVDLFDTDLPAMDDSVLSAKYAVLHGRELTDEQAAAWRAVETVIEPFRAADKYLLAVPMWNFGIPYRLKQYFDVIVQPTYTFAVTDSGYEGLVTGKPAMVIYASGGAYVDTEYSAYDMQKPYVKEILAFMGFTEIDRIVVEPTLAGGPEAAEAAVEDAIADALDKASTF